MASYRQDAQRRVSHILVEFGDDEAAAKATIESLLTRVNAGEDFATLASEHSADTFSGENGGDLIFNGKPNNLITEKKSRLKKYLELKF